MSNAKDARAGQPNRGLGPYGGGARDLASPRQLLLHPVNLVPIPVWFILATARHYGLVANVPLWLLVGSVVLAHAGSMLFALVWPPGSPKAKPALHLFVEFALVGLAVYDTGWGPVLAIGFIFSAAGHLSVDGARMGRTAIVAALLTLGAGELAIALGWAPTLLPEPQGHGLAAIVGVGICCVIWMLSFTHREKEVVEKRLRRSEERMRALVRYASDAIVVMNPNGDVSYASPAIERLLGIDASSFTHFDDGVVHPDFIDMARATFREVVDGGPDTARWIELRMQHADGEYRWFEIAITNLIDDPAVGAMVCNIRDITERRSAQEELTYQAHHDALTRLPNRWFFLDRIEHAQQEARGRNGWVAVLFVDVDQFKTVNDRLGHEVGDAMLVEVANRLRACLRPVDVVARFGGDEFTVLLDHITDENEALQIAERITQALRAPMSVAGQDLLVTGSVGVAVSRGGDVSAGDLLRNADVAMYLAKQNGRARWELFDGSLGVFAALGPDADLLALRTQA